MSGTVEGGRQAAATNKMRYGVGFYKMLGRKGGKISRGGGFGSAHVGTDGLTGLQRASIVGRKGGQISRKPTNAELNARRSEGSRHITREEEVQGREEIKIRYVS
jgi:general stress protein YciG